MPWRSVFVKCSVTEKSIGIPSQRRRVRRSAGQRVAKNVSGTGEREPRYRAPFKFPREDGDMAEKIRLGLIGASVRGTWSARSHLPALQASSDVELTAVCTTRADSAEGARQAWGARLA